MNTNTKIALFALLLIILGLQSFWVFKDSERKGMNKWLWGIFCFLNTPTNLLIYLIVSRTLIKRKICIECGHKNNKNAHYCENCGFGLEREED
jgi:ribosomal protein L40E